MIKHGPSQQFLLKDLLPCLHFSQNFKNLGNLGGVKLKHLLEIQNTWIHDILRPDASANASVNDSG